MAAKAASRQSGEPPPLGRGVECLDRKGLRQKVIHTRRHAALTVLRQRIGDGDDRDALATGLGCPDLPGGLKTIHLRHSHVHQDEIWPLSLPRLDRQAPIGYLDRKVAQIF